MSADGCAPRPRPENICYRLLQFLAYLIRIARNDNLQEVALQTAVTPATIVQGMLWIYGQKRCICSNARAELNATCHAPFETRELQARFVTKRPGGSQSP